MQSTQSVRTIDGRSEWKEIWVFWLFFVCCFLLLFFHTDWKKKSTWLLRNLNYTTEFFGKIFFEINSLLTDCGSFSSHCKTVVFQLQRRSNKWWNSGWWRRARTFVETANMKVKVINVNTELYRIRKHSPEYWLA